MAARLVVAGVSGSGKSTVGAALAEHLGLPFCDGDDLHSPDNVAKMSAGIPLDDADRRPWLLDVGRWLAARRDGGVVACSALKRSHRDLIRSTCADAWIIQLVGDPELVRARQAGRTDHFMPVALMDSQFDAFEPLGADEDGAAVDIGGEVEDVVARVARLVPDVGRDWPLT